MLRAKIKKYFLVSLAFFARGGRTHLVIDHSQPVDERHWMHEVCEVDVGPTHHPEPGETVVERVGPRVAYHPSTSRNHQTTIRGLFQVQSLTQFVSAYFFSKLSRDHT